MDATPKSSAPEISCHPVPAPVSLRIVKAITAQPLKCSPLEDTVEVSPAALELARRGVQSRFARMSEIHAAIKAGTYETPERVEATVRRMLDVFG